MTGVWIVLGIALYFLPTIRAEINPQFKQRSTMFTLNLFLGWLFIPWVGLLAWTFWKK